MAKFFITTPMQNNGKTFQFNFETDEVRDITEFCHALEHGAYVIGERFDNRDPSNQAKRSKMAISSAMAALIQDSLPPLASAA